MEQILFREFIEMARAKNEENVNCIYGTGLAAQMGYDALKRLSIMVDCFIDSDETKIGKSFYGKKIKSLTQIPQNATVFILANPKYGIHERLSERDIQRYMYVDPNILFDYKHGYFEGVRNKLKQNRFAIEKAYNLCEDKKSCNVFESVLQHRIEHRLDLIEKVYDCNQYFGNDLIRKLDGNVVDCGAFTGDTLIRFLKQLEGQSEYQYYAFEAESDNYEFILSWCKENHINNVEVYNIAVWDHEETLAFRHDCNDEKVAGRIAAEGDNIKKVNGNSLDNILGNVQIDMIMMDIEGAEIKALRGAKKCIRKNMPCLAISAYHQIEHLWEIPLMIKELDEDYQIYFRHHRWNLHDTVCYAIPRHM